MTEHFKAPEKIQLSDKEIANLLDAQFKTLVIKMLTELVESVRKPDEKMKPMLRETKENVQGTRRRVRRAPLLPLGPSPTYSVKAQQPALHRPGENIRLRPLN